MAYNIKTEMYDGYIYKITNIENGCSYIGQTSRSVKMRVREHFLSANILGADKYFTNKNDFNIKTIELLSCKTLDGLFELLDEREKYWIKYYDTFHNGYNCNLGGQRERSVYDGKQILAYTKQGEYIGKFRTMTDAGLATGANRNDVSKSCKSIDKFKFGNDYLFRFESNPLSDEEVNELKLKYPLVYQYSMSGELLNIFTTCADAARHLKDKYDINTGSRYISRACNKDNRTLYGFVWRKYPYKFNDFSIPLRKRIEQHDITTGELLNVFDTCQDAADAVVGDPARIGAVANKRDKCLTAAGFFWCYEGEFDQERCEKALYYCLKNKCYPGISKQ